MEAAAEQIRLTSQSAMEHFEGERATMRALLRSLKGSLGMFQAETHHTHLVSIPAQCFIPAWADLDPVFSPLL